MRKERIKRNHRAPLFIILSFSLLPGALGCVAANKPGAATVRPYYISQAPESQARPSTEGSLWPGPGRETSLFADQKARKVNDIVTVQIVEDIQATKAASTKTDKKSSYSAGVDALFGFEKSIAKRNSNFNPASMVDASVANSFDGSGSTSRSEKITGAMTATVRDVLPNGNLVIGGSREVVINNERQFMILSGVVRPKDISAFNTVLSTSISDANVTYTGNGVLSDKQKPGWFIRALDTFWPF